MRAASLTLVAGALATHWPGRVGGGPGPVAGVATREGDVEPGAVGPPDRSVPTAPSDAAAADSAAPVAEAETWPLVRLQVDGLPAIGLDRPSPRWAAVVESLGGEPHPLRLPVAVALDSHGHRYVVDAGHQRIQVFDRDGRFVTMWGDEGDDAGQFRFRPRHRCDAAGAACAPAIGGGVAVDEQGRVYVADYGNHRVQVFDRAGRLLSLWGREGGGPGEFGLPHGIAVDGAGRVYVGDLQDHRIQVFDDAGRCLAQWGGTWTGDGRFMWPGGLAVDDQGQVYVADTGNGRVQVFDGQGRLVARWMTAAPAGDEAPVAGIALDRAGRVYVGGAGDRIRQFDRGGRALATWAGRGDGPGELRGPAGLAIDADGDLHVADRDNHRVQRFRLLLPVAG
jgi:DNA-binding beta-propeller fold protein YncE